MSEDAGCSWAAEFRVNQNSDQEGSSCAGRGVECSTALQAGPAQNNATCAGSDACLLSLNAHCRKDRLLLRAGGGSRLGMPITSVVPIGRYGDFYLTRANDKYQLRAVLGKRRMGPRGGCGEVRRRCCRHPPDSSPLGWLFCQPIPLPSRGAPLLEVDPTSVDRFSCCGKRGGGRLDERHALRSR